MSHRKFFASTVIAMVIGGTQTLSALAQPWPGYPGQASPAPGGPVTTLRDPLIGGAPTSAAFIPPAYGQAPPVGAGNQPPRVNPGMGGPPTLLPWNRSIPANSADQRNTSVPLGVTPAVVSAPGVLGPALTGRVPGPESTLGSDPGSLTAPSGYINAAQQANINPNGGIPGIGGYAGTIPTLRRGGQATNQWELRGRNSAIGGIGGDASQDNVTRSGPWP